MDYRIEFTARATRDLDDLPAATREKVILRVYAMSRDLQGNVKRLTSFVPRYRLRVGDYRVLFDLSGDLITIYRVVHRRDAYR